MSERKAPFSMGWTLRITAKYMRKAIDISIRKTFARIDEYANDQEKSAEIFETLQVLHRMRNDLDEFQNVHKNLFKGDNENERAA